MIMVLLFFLLATVPRTVRGEVQGSVHGQGDRRFSVAVPLAGADERSEADGVDLLEAQLGKQGPECRQPLGAAVGPPPPLQGLSVTDSRRIG